MDSIQASVTAGGVPRIALNPDEAARSAGVSRTRIFQAIRNRELTCRKTGKATVIEVSELRRWIQALPSRGRHPTRSPTTSRNGAATMRPRKVEGQS